MATRRLAHTEHDPFAQNLGPFALLFVTGAGWIRHQLGLDDAHRLQRDHCVNGPTSATSMRGRGLTFEPSCHRFSVR